MCTMSLRRTNVQPELLAAAAATLGGAVATASTNVSAAAARSSACTFARVGNAVHMSTAREGHDARSDKAAGDRGNVRAR